MVRVLICDDQTVVREGLSAILSTDPEIEVVGLAGDGREAVDLTSSLEPDVVLMDLQMPRLNGVQATQRIRQEQPDVHILVLTTFAADDWIYDAIRAGASGYLLKDTRRDELIAAIKGTVQGKSFLDPAIAGKVMQQAVTGSPAPTPLGAQTLDLSERELEILGLLVEGYGNREIARQLHLAHGTVRNYVSTILSKLSVSDRTQAAVEALRQGLVDQGSS